MKRTTALLIVSLLMLSAPKVFSQDFDNSGQYMDYIHKQQEKVSKRYMSYTSASAHGKREKKVEALRSKMIDEISEARMNINSMPSFKGDKSYRDTAVSFMKFYYSVMNDDYSKIINMEEIAEQSYDDMEAYLLAQEKIDEKLEEANARLKKAQQEFAAKNNINLVNDKSELGAMMEESGNVSKHYHDVYLVFFKPNIQEEHMTEAIGKGNITGIEQSKNAMVKYAQEGLEKLKTMKGYRGDNIMISACRNVLNFYLKEAEKTGPVSEYFITKERFEKMKKDMDKKSSPSKEEIASFNNAVNDYNKSVNTYNSFSNEMNQRRADVMNEWNKAVKNFFDEHTPHYK